VELGEGVVASCHIAKERATKDKDKGTSTESSTPAKADLSSLGSMLQARWKSGPPPEEGKPQDLRAGQVRNFRISKLDVETKKIELDLV
jgi:small subunit ribosomal protein S1